MNRTIQLLKLVTVFGVSLLVAVNARGEDGEKENRLGSMTIEELLNIEVSTAARKPQTQHSVPAAIFVITREDIERSPATSIPELLRMAPGVNVAKLDASKWSVTIRGFSGRFADKLLVLVDGRSIYTPLFSGTIWEDLHYPMELIERIEIIRGPGSASWGANAVNGIINIITREAEDMDGGSISLAAGSEIDADFSFLYGGKLSTGRHYRLYLREVHVDGGELSVPARQQDDNWHATQIGGGMSWQIGDDKLTLIVDGSDTNLNDTYPVSPFRYPFRRYVTDDAHDRWLRMSATWERPTGEDGGIRLQSYVERYLSNTLFATEARTTGDLDFQHRFRPTDRQEIVWGLGLRYTSDHPSPERLGSFDPDRRRYRTFSGFIQDEISFLDGELHLTLGTKIEHNDYTGLEVQPTARLAWTPTDRTTWWGAVTRAVGTPSRAESDVRLLAFALPGIDVVQLGNKNLDSETVLTLEAGVRHVFSDQLSVDVSAFYSDYDKFRTIVLRPPFLSFQLLPPRLVIPFRATNDAGAVAKGLEVVLDWQPHARWRTHLMWSYLDIGIQSHNNYIDLITPLVADDTPTHQINWQHHFSLSKNVELDIDFRYVDALESLDIDGYSTMDVRLGWRPREDLHLELVGQNLLQPDHAEFSPTIGDTLPSKPERGVFGRVSWEF